MRTVNVGVIGVGAMGYNHARVYYKLEEANLVAVSDVSERTLNKVAKKYDAKGFTDYEDLLKDPEIEVVSVCVPTTFHHDVVMEAIKHGKHVLVEKPIGKRDNMKDYDTIFVGFPIWWYVAPTIINTFLESYDLTGKTIIPFATSGGSDIGKTNERLASSCKGAKLMDGKVFKGSVGHQELAAWVEGLGL